MNTFFSSIHQLIGDNLVVHEILHGVFAIPFAILLWEKTGSIHLVLIVFMVSYFIDLDHLADYFSFYGLKFNFSRFLKCKYFNKKKVAYIPLHAWEWLLILGLVILIKQHNWDSYYLAVFLGLLPHYILDSISVGSCLFYSITYRYVKYFVGRAT